MASLNITTNAKEVANDIKEAQNAINGLVNSSSTPSMANNGSSNNTNNVNNLGSSELNGTETRDQNLHEQTEETKKQTTILERILEFFRNNSNKTGSELTSVEKKEIVEKQKEANSDLQTGNNLVNATSQTVSQALNNNTFGILQRGFQGTSNFLEKQSAKAKGNDADGLANALGAAGILGAVLAAGSGLSNQALGQYQELIPSTDDYYRAYGDDVGKHSAKYNAIAAVDMFEKNQMYAEGTGMSNSEFFRTSSELGRYGVKNAETAAQMTSSAANYARYTGGDVNAYQDMMGTAYRYNKEQGDTVLKNALAGAEISGLGKNGMPEFLAGLQQVVQKGISDGFKDSTKDVADSLSFLSQLNGGDALWSGEQGTNRYITMASGLAGATSLSNSSQMLAYQAVSGMVSGMTEDQLKESLGKSYIKDGGYLNTLAMMEKNPDAKTFEAIAKQVQGVYGNDIQGQVATYQQIFGLNNSGSMQLYNAFSKLESGEIKIKDFDEIVESVTSNAEYHSDATKQIDATNAIQKEVAKVGQNLMTIKTESLTSISKGVNSILGSLMKDNYAKLADTALDSIIDKDEGKGSWSDLISGYLEDPTKQQQGMELIEYIDSLSPQDKIALNRANWQERVTLEEARENPQAIYDAFEQALESNKKIENKHFEKAVIQKKYDDLYEDTNFNPPEKDKRIKKLWENDSEKYTPVIESLLNDPKYTQIYEDKLPEKKRGSFMTLNEYNKAIENANGDSNAIDKANKEFNSSLYQVLKQLKDAIEKGQVNAFFEE